MPAFLADYPPDRVAEITGLSEADIRTAARMIADAGEWMSCWTMGLNQSTHGTWNTNAICNLHLATGAICRPGSGPMSLTGQPNAMGGREMGYMGPGLPGQRSVASATDREFVEEQWGLPPGTIRDRHRPRHDRDVRGARQRRHQGMLDHLHESRCHRGESEDSHRRAGNGRARHHPGRLPGRPRPTATPTSCCPPPVGGVRRRHGELRTQPHAAAGGHPARRAGTPGLAVDLPGRRAHGFR